MIFLWLYILGWVVAVPVALWFRMSNQICTISQQSLCTGHWHTCETKERGELHARTAEDYGASAGLALIWPALVLLGCFIGVGFVLYGAVRTIGRLAPKTAGERRREAKLLAARESDADRLAEKLDRDDYPEIAITEAMNRSQT